MGTLLLRDIMRGDPTTIDARLTIQDAATLMSRVKVRHLIAITPSGTATGVVSQRDVFRHLAGSDLSRRESLIRDVMSEPLRWGRPDMPVSDAAKQILEERIGCLAVLDGKNLVGIVTRSDLLTHGSWYTQTRVAIRDCHVRLGIYPT